MVELGRVFAGADEADLQAVDLAEPAFTAGFRDPGVEVVAVSTSRGRWVGSVYASGLADLHHRRFVSVSWPWDIQGTSELRRGHEN